MTNNFYRGHFPYISLSSRVIQAYNIVENVSKPPAIVESTDAHGTLNIPDTHLQT